MSSSPLPMRRAGPNDHLSAKAKDMLLATPSGGNFYGSTPGGSRIVYSREQLLSLASSPLSKTPPNIPAEISRSPDKTAFYNGNGASQSKQGREKISMDAVLGRKVNGSQGVGGEVVENGGQSANGINGHGRTTAATLSRSPPVASRDPGSAFNFSNGPVSPTKGTNEALKTRSAESIPNAALGRRGNDIGSKVNGGHGEEQFDLEM
ncbi:hypothetical protein CBS101457_006194 [Exobasidium rhododendri]|nr:hypothetical protein CBS101457_006194 [Exobasidium rhododendri]